MLELERGKKTTPYLKDTSRIQFREERAIAVEDECPGTCGAHRGDSSSYVRRSRLLGWEERAMEEGIPGGDTVRANAQRPKV